jgi:uncharacterized heparinase superfamily protein
MLQTNQYPENILESLTLQIDHLSKRLEYHILGNHLIANAKALCFAGIFFESNQANRWLEKGIDLLLKQIDEQILEDGGHFELTPMYHSIILEDLLDILSLLQGCPKFNPTQQLESKIRKVLPAMCDWLNNMTHPDGEIAFFNDSALDIAQPPMKLINFALQLGIHLNAARAKETTRLKASGYINAKQSNAHLIVDVGEVGPAYQPGHAHADTLSFELSVGSQRIFVNSGTGEYGVSQRRLEQRSTPAHNTLAIDGKNSSQVWSGFRVAKRARPGKVIISEEGDSTRICCSHDGYNTYFRRCTVRREWVLSNSSLHITDSIDAQNSVCRSYFHIHPDMKLTSTNPNEFRITNSEHTIVLKSLAWGKIIESCYYPEFGKSTQNKTIVLETSGADISCEISWGNVHDTTNAP